ncbi:hypothetical protein [Waterburya agarophytonicola]|nr:hypothetical protein [Waterburya agarophytonicola]
MNAMPSASCVIAMRVISAGKHPNADALRLYIMTAPDVEELQIIANIR